MGNNPITGVDPDGGFCIDTDGNPCPDGEFEGQINIDFYGNAWQWKDGGYSTLDAIYLDEVVLTGSARKFNPLENYSPLPGATPGVKDMQGCSECLIDGVSLSLEFANPIAKIPRTDYYGVGFEFGFASVYDPTTDTTAPEFFYTWSRTSERGVAFGLNLNYFGFKNRIDEPITAERLSGWGTSSGVNAILGYTVSGDGIYRLNRGSTYNVHTVSFGVGIDLGFTEWETLTNFFDK